MTIFDCFYHLIAQNAPSLNNTISPSTDINLLARQFDFFFRAVGLIFTAIAILLTLIGLLTAIFVIVTSWQNKKTLKEAKADIEKSVKRQVNNYIATTIEKRVESLERTLEKEEVIGSTIVKYVVSIEQNNGRKAEEVKLLEQRGFKDVFVRFYPLQRDRKQYDVLVLDFVNKSFTNNEEKEKEVLDIVKQASENMLPQTALVVYVAGRIEGLDDVLKKKQVYFTPANNAITLMGRVVDAAQMAYALQHGNNQPFV
jgi:hypothetical protein